MSEQPYHIPALLPQCLDALDIKPDGIYVDATYGGGGHSRAIMERLDAGQGGHLYSFDQDIDAVKRAGEDPRFTMVYSNFRFITNFMRYYDVDGVDGVLADLGVSFHHFDTPDRGFSFRADGPLDMRMNRSASRAASSLLADIDRDRLADILKLYGELSQARRMADAIVRAREGGRKLDTVGALIETVTPLIDPRKEKKELAQLFQALRIEVNDEMGALRELLEGALRVLRPGGRLAVITYHSLEDRMVKNFLKTGDITGKVDKDFFGRVNAPFKLLASKPIVPDDDEVARNPRSRSAKLRVGIKIG
ncbi:16S rRNA (cytosine(1402)-N(4))-methyltransferase RsmH [Duncaniella freteri]|jgi:16S rRNA (cytosine1402-N4)-methyltransferase|uniref:Ribosomal RNA small subunit methyltransferase H n=3 Tax=Duncaniella TaxID=2518495 RepID=A0A4Z0V9X3_9BACT|nr:16S rRNA (cytosine(1402)-N(4))-methyltransferase RsmH [Duncaniella freteri]NBJ07170.1 16S rRNA (cytosine(1402)-N(4))-methyltransferase RsmH [Alistipes sp. Z76]NCE69250.1 16S rRNA (cytosine(1402)-N(4))-methyltransferase RsmH [Muribaculaceae bacterium M3]TGG40120.1 16S rRNA (cytosine(1402)-N(4))-methyltransferase RsmH [Duncaniella freteri]